MPLSGVSRFSGQISVEVEYAESNLNGDFGAGFIGVLKEHPSAHVFGWSRRPLSSGSHQVHANHLAQVPSRIACPELASVASHGIAAWQGLRDVGYVRPGQSVRITQPNSVLGKLALQLAGALGAEVIPDPTVACDVILDAERVLPTEQVVTGLRPSGKYLVGARWWLIPGLCWMAAMPGKPAVRRLPHCANRIDLEDLGELVARRIIKLDGLLA